MNRLSSLIQSSKDGAAAGERGQRFLPLLTDGMGIEMPDEDGRDTIVIHLDRSGGSDEARCNEECVVSFIYLTMREMFPENAPPSEIHFTHPEPEDRSEFDRILGTSVRFGQPENAIVVLHDGVPPPPRSATADPRLTAILERHAEQLLSQLPPVDDFVSEVRARMTEELKGGDPSAEHLASGLGMSVRTLRRRLDAHGTQHKELLEEIRTELAQRYLRDPRIEISEIACLLAFSEPSAFHRAFKRWTGKTPARYRAEHT